MDDRSQDPFLLTIGGTKDSRALLRISDHKFVIGKEEFFPHSAEMHYFRVAKRHWSVCFERIHKAGFRIISTSVPWNIHETRQGEFDFAGTYDQTQDLVVFLELCREFGFKIILKPGPWLGQECDNGGIPDFATRNPEAMATGQDGEMVVADPGAGASTVNLPSYLSTRFQIQLKNYFSIFSEVVRNYIYPRGPVFMIELDFETSFGGHFDPLSADYNPTGGRKYYGEFLEGKYESLEKINKLWKARLKNFKDAEPPTTRKTKTNFDVVRMLDWIEFREWTVNRYAERLTELLSQTEVSVLFARSLAFRGAYSFPNLADAKSDDRILYTVNMDWDTPFADTIRRSRSVSAWQPTGFCTNMAVGTRHPDPEAGHSYRPITAPDTARLLTAGLGAGLKGFNFHMFVGRPRWYDGVLELDGAINPSYDVVREAATRLPAVRYDIMKDFADVALVQYRPYQRIASIETPGIHDYMADLAGPAFNAVASDLLALSYDYRVFDLECSNRLEKYGTIIVPVGEIMDAAAQQRLVDLYKGGAHLILFGVLPQFNCGWEPCEILANAIGFKTVREDSISKIETKHGRFSVCAYGSIKKTPNDADKLANIDTKIMAASTSSGEGMVSVLTFSPGSFLQPEKLVFFRHILERGKLSTPVSTSDPRVHVILQGHAKAALLLIYDTAETLGVTDDVSTSPSSRGVIISADLSQIGLNSQRVTLTDILDRDSRRVLTKNLSSGIEFRLGQGDSRLYTIEKR